jgi:hypothetical protein
MILITWLFLTLRACELKVIVEYPGETGLDTELAPGDDTGVEAETTADDNF